MGDSTGKQSLEGLLFKAREALENERYETVLEICEKSARENPNEQMGFLLLAGHAARGKGDPVQSEKAYKKVLKSVDGATEGTVAVHGYEIDPGVVEYEAWGGLLQLYQEKGDVQGQVECLENMLKLTPEGDPRDDGQRIELAERYAEMGAYGKSQMQFWHVLGSMPVGSDERLDLLGKMADTMLKQKNTHVDREVEQMLLDSKKTNNDADVEERTVSCIKLDVMAAVAAQDDELDDVGVSLNHVLLEIVETAPSSLKYLPYREEYLKRCLLRIFHHPPRSTERQQLRLAALRECVGIICRGGPCSSFAFEAAVWLLEEEEEITGGQVSVGGQEVGGMQGLAGGVQAGAEGHIGQGRHATVAFAVENFSRRMYHQFPTNPSAQVLLTLMLRRHALLDKQPVPQSERRRWEVLLERAMQDDSDIDCGSGFKALAELHYENRHYQKSHDISLRGLKWLQERRDRGHESLTQIGLGLRLVLAKSLRRLKKLDEAEAQFKVLAGWVSEGEIAFSEMCGSAPTSIHQQALRGIALVEVEKGNLDAALSQYERILGKAALGRGPAEHWAHADYGWLLFKQGDKEHAKFHLEQSIHVSEEEGCAATDSQVGEHRYRLGEVYWSLGGKFKMDKGYAYHMFYDSAKVEGHAQAPALAALGRYYDEVEHDMTMAQRCYKKALSLEPTLELAGNLICRSLLGRGQSENDIIKFCSLFHSTHAGAAWTYREIGAAELRSREWERAIWPLLKAVKLDSQDSTSWENLGIAYFNLEKFSSSRKASRKALQVSGDCRYARVILCWIDLFLGKDSKALPMGNTDRVDSTKNLSPTFLALALSSYRDALGHLSRGAAVTAVELLDEACSHTKDALLDDSRSSMGFKLLGDIQILEIKSRIVEMVGSHAHCGSMVEDILREWDHQKASIRRAYAKCIHLRPYEPCYWANMCPKLSEYAKSLRYEDGGADMLLLGSFEEVSRCLMASLRLDPLSPEYWSRLGSFSCKVNDKLSKYALARALSLNKNYSIGWQTLSHAVPRDSLLEGFSKIQAQQTRRDSYDIWSTLLKSKVNPDWDLYSRITVSEIFGKDLLEEYLQTCMAEDSMDVCASYTALLSACWINPLDFDTMLGRLLSAVRCGKYGVGRKLVGICQEWLTDNSSGSPGPEIVTLEILSFYLKFFTGENASDCALPCILDGTIYLDDPRVLSLLVGHVSSLKQGSVQVTVLVYFLDVIMMSLRLHSNLVDEAIEAFVLVLSMFDSYLSSAPVGHGLAPGFEKLIQEKLHSFSWIIEDVCGRQSLITHLRVLGEHKRFAFLQEYAEDEILIKLENVGNESSQKPKRSEDLNQIEVTKALHTFPWLICQEESF